MEKRGIIADGITPPEKDASLKAGPGSRLCGQTPAEKQAQLSDLDSDFRKRAAYATQNSLN